MNASPIEPEIIKSDEEGKYFMLAHVLMGLFIISTAIGFGIMVGAGAGFVAFGVASGIYGYILGDN